MRVALDTNVLVYAEGINGMEPKKLALELMQRLPLGCAFVPVQVAGELFRVLIAKGRSPESARASILGLRDNFSFIETTTEVMFAAAELVVDHQFNIWDAVVMAASVAAGCRLLLSEDIQAGFTWNGLTVVDPFAEKKHDLLTALLNQEPRLN
jgi:predicted nucleic acid-binding protein